jgi:hypothetical protein
MVNGEPGAITQAHFKIPSWIVPDEIEKEKKSDMWGSLCRTPGKPLDLLLKF